MNKNTLANTLAFIIGLYFIVRAAFFYKNEKITYAAIYFFAGVIAIVSQLIVNKIKNKRKK